jgi:hypothetical protein
MRIHSTSALALGAALLLSLAGASPSFAKAHDQGVNDSTSRGSPDRAGGNPNTGDTVNSAQTLGDRMGNGDSGNGRSTENPASENAGGGRN